MASPVTTPASYTDATRAICALAIAASTSMQPDDEPIYDEAGRLLVPARKSSRYPVQVPHHSTPSTLRVVCAWCDKELHAGVAPVSHGICDDCAAKNF